MPDSRISRQSEWQVRWLNWKQCLKPWHIGLGIVLAIAFYMVWNWWISPEHRIAQFQAAINSGNLDGMMALASPSEVSRLGLTDAKLRGMLAEASQSPDGVQLANYRVKSINPVVTPYNRWIEFHLLDRHGRVLTTPDGYAARVLVIAYNSPTGWHIGLSQFLLLLSSARHGPGHYAEICHRNNIPAELFQPEDASWRAVRQASEQQSAKT